MESDPSSSDPTTDADGDLPEQAAQSKAGPASLEVTAGQTVHPSGLASAAEAAADSDENAKPGRSAVRRHAGSN